MNDKQNNPQPAEKQTVKNGEGRESTGQFAEGNPGGPGRPKGSPNKIGGELKADLWAAYCAKGGAEWFGRLPDRTFAQLIAKILPRELAADIRAKVGRETGPDWENMTDQQLKATGHATGHKIRRIDGELYFYQDADRALLLDDARMIVEGVEQAKRFKQRGGLPPVAAECLEHTIAALRKHLPELAKFQKQAETALTGLDSVEVL